MHHRLTAETKMLEDLLSQLKTSPQTIEFSDTIAVIESLYDFTETPFQNGDVENAAGQNSGSCKIFAFAKLQGLDQTETLALFGKYYREDVLEHLDGSDHANIRAFLQDGWAGLRIDADHALVAKS